MKHTPLIVAELSANHLGSLERALHIIDAAAKAGADAIKFQTWQEDGMVLDKGYRLESGPWAGRLLHELYAEAWTPWRWHETLYAYARANKLIPFSSVFDKGSVDFLETLDCPMYKISSFEIEDLDLIAYAASKGKPMIISTGMAPWNTIVHAAARVYETPCRDLTLLKCTSAYPAPVEEAGLATMKRLRTIATAVGVSDHTPGSSVPVVATAMGATMIEKHLTLSRADGGPDAAFSLEPDEFAGMVKACREARLIIGQETWGPTPAEHASKPLRRSLYWAADGDAGHVVAQEDIATARPGEGLPPSRLPTIINRRLKVPVTRGMPVREEQFDK